MNKLKIIYKKRHFILTLKSSSKSHHIIIIKAAASMLKKPTAKCIKQGEATKVCTSSQCLNHSFICFSEDCDCRSQHANCLFQSQFSNVNYFLDSLVLKNQSGTKCFESLLEFCDSSIKQLLILKGTIEKLIQKDDAFLQLSEKNMINCLKNNNQNVINGKIVANTIQSIKARPKANVAKIKQLVNNSIDKNSKKVKQIIQSVLVSVNLKNETNNQISRQVQTIENYTFTLSFSNKYRGQDIIGDNEEVSCRNRHSHHYNYVLIQPQLSANSSGVNCPVTLIIKSAYQTAVGVAFFKRMKNQNFQSGNHNNSFPLGYFVENDYKKEIQLTEQQQQRQQFKKSRTKEWLYEPPQKRYQQFRGWKNSHVIHILLHDDSKTLTIINSTTGTQHTKTILLGNRLELFYCVGMKNNFGIIQLLR